MIDPVAQEIHAKASKLGISFHDRAYFDKMKPEAKSLIVSHLEAGSDEERIMAYYNTVFKIASMNFRPLRPTVERSIAGRNLTFDK